jgi:hypothetical protein
MVTHFFVYQYEYVDYAIIYEFVESALAIVLDCVTLNEICKLETPLPSWVSTLVQPTVDFTTCILLPALTDLSYEFRCPPGSVLNLKVSTLRTK